MLKWSKFLSELLRRKVVRLLGAYIVLLWLAAQGVAQLAPVFGLPDWAVRAFIYGGIALIPLLAWLSWKFNITPPQLVLDPKDVELTNPSLAWAQRRHDNTDAGFILLKWDTADGRTHEARYFKAMSFGRAHSNDVPLGDERVSRFHAVLWAEKGGWHVRDDSTNGTYINHARVTAPTRLPHEGELRFHVNGPVVRFIIDTPAKTVMS